MILKTTLLPAIKLAFRYLFFISCGLFQLACATSSYQATSSVDTTTEKEIQRALDNLVKGRTTIAIAHRLSTLRKADRLVVLDKGEIVEIGSHDQLMEARGAYYTLYQAQLRHAAELVEGGAIGESLEEEQEEKLEEVAKHVGGGV